MNKPVFYIILLLCLCASFGIAQQNLVYNGDFEEYTDCPTTASYPQQSIKEIEKCLGWNAPTYGTSDFYHLCAVGTNVSIPTNSVGEQAPYNGEGYAGTGFANYTGGSGIDGYNGPMWWEYLQGTLLQPLEKDRIYRLSLEVSLAEISDLIIHEFGVYFSSNPMQSPNTASLNVSPQCVFKRTDHFNDTVNWMHVESYFIAKGGEEYLVIGNFLDNVQTDTVRRYDWFPNPNPLVNYMYIDHVVVEESLFEIPNVFTPNGDGINDTWSLGIDLPSTNIRILNRWGNIVIEGHLQNFFWDGRTRTGVECEEGSYFYALGERTGFIQLVR